MEEAAPETAPRQSISLRPHSFIRVQGAVASAQHARQHPSPEPSKKTNVTCTPAGTKHRLMAAQRRKPRHSQVGHQRHRLEPSPPGQVGPLGAKRSAGDGANESIGQGIGAISAPHLHAYSVSEDPCLRKGCRPALPSAGCSCISNAMHANGSIADALVLFTQPTSFSGKPRRPPCCDFRYDSEPLSPSRVLAPLERNSKSFFRYFTMHRICTLPLSSAFAIRQSSGPKQLTSLSWSCSSVASASTPFPRHAGRASNLFRPTLVASKYRAHRVVK